MAGARGLIDGREMLAGTAAAATSWQTERCESRSSGLLAVMLSDLGYDLHLLQIRPAATFLAVFGHSFLWLVCVYTWSPQLVPWLTHAGVGNNDAVWIARSLSPATVL